MSMVFRMGSSGEAQMSGTITFVRYGHLNDLNEHNLFISKTTNGNFFLHKLKSEHTMTIPGGA